MEAKEKIILPEKYYHTYFLDLVNFVRQHSAHLLGPEELEFIEAFENLGEDSQCLFLRFSNRKGPFFRTDKLQYPEINISQALEELLRLGFILRDFSAEPGLLKLFTRKELAALYDPSGTMKDLYKEHLVLEIFEKYSLNVLLENYDVVKVVKQDPFEFIKLLYFGHYRGQMTEFVIRDVGNIKLEQLDDAKFNPWFKTNEEATALFRISKLSRIIRAALRMYNAAEIVPTLSGIDFEPFTKFPKSQKVLDRVFLDLGLQLERERLPEIAVEFYRKVRRPPSRERQIRIYSQLGEAEKAMELAKETIGNYHNATELLFARDFVSRPKKRINRSTTAREKHASTIQLKPTEEMRVEHLVLQHFEEKGFRGIHSENFLWRNLFGLFFWEELFDQSYNNFHNPLQRASSDLYDPGFYPKRKTQLKKKLSDFPGTSQFVEKILITYDQKKGINNPLTYWFDDFPAILQEGVTLIPYQGISDILLEMSKNLKDNSTGFPDLFLWKEGQYHFYEVKSPNDHLSSQQLFWINFMENLSLNVDIVRVAY